MVSEGEDFKPRRKPSKGLGEGPGSPPKLRPHQHRRRTETKGEALDDIAAYSKNPHLKKKGYLDPNDPNDTPLRDRKKEKERVARGAEYGNSTSPPLILIPSSYPHVERDGHLWFKGRESRPSTNNS